MGWCFCSITSHERSARVRIQGVWRPFFIFLKTPNCICFKQFGIWTTWVRRGLFLMQVCKTSKFKCDVCLVYFTVIRPVDTYALQNMFFLIKRSSISLTSGHKLTVFSLKMTAPFRRAAFLCPFGFHTLNAGCCSNTDDTAVSYSTPLFCTVLCQSSTSHE